MALDTLRQLRIPAGRRSSSELVATFAVGGPSVVGWGELLDQGSTRGPVEHEDDHVVGAEPQLGLAAEIEYGPEAEPVGEDEQPR